MEGRGVRRSGSGAFVLSGLILLIASLTVGGDVAVASHPKLQRISLSSDGIEGNSHSGHLGDPAISDDGRVVAFISEASNLVPADTNGVRDVFVHDRETGVTSRVSVASDGTQANGPAASFTDLAVSADGNLILFSSLASTLVPGDLNNAFDVFLHDRAARTTVLVSATPDGSPGNGSSGTSGVALSKDGRYAAFTSSADDLVAGDTPMGDVFVRDLWAGATDKASTAAVGGFADAASHRPQFDGDGDRMVFASSATNLVEGDTNGKFDIFLWERKRSIADAVNSGQPAGVIRRVSVSTDGSQSDGLSGTATLSTDGNVVAFSSGASNLHPADQDGIHDIFVRDLTTGDLEVVTPSGDDLSQSPSLSSDGRFVGFESWAQNLTCARGSSLGNAYVYDRGTESMALISKVGNGSPDSQSSGPVLTPDARHLVFGSFAANLVPDDNNDAKDIFVHELPTTSPVTLDCPVGRAVTEVEQLTVGGSATPGTMLKLLLGDATVGSASVGGYGSWQTTVTLPEGQHEVRVAQPSGGGDATFSVLVDLSPPTSTITTPDGDLQASVPLLAEEVVITGTADDGPLGSGVRRVRLIFDPLRTVPPTSRRTSLAEGTDTWEWRGFLETGTWKVTAVATDVVGRADPNPPSIRILVVP